MASLRQMKQAAPIRCSTLMHDVRPSHLQQYRSVFSASGLQSVPINATNVIKRRGRCSPTSLACSSLPLSAIQLPFRGVHQRSSSRSMSSSTVQHSNAMQDAYIGIGSNIGNCALHIQQAMHQLRYNPTTTHALQVIRTSSMYQSQPMYKTDQPTFLNAVIHIRTTLQPTQLLLHLKSIEHHHGRHNHPSTIRNSPRVLDLDIIFYGEQHIQLDNLQIPHPRIAEREFVLKPLCELNPDLKLVTADGSTQTVQQVLTTLYTQPHYQSQLQLCTPCVTNRHTDTGWSVFQWHRRTYIMGICNVTPDSFSDGGRYESSRVMQHKVEFVDSVGQMIEDGLDVLDLGGQSTRPDSTLLTANEELHRLAPIIDLVRHHYPTLPVSIDTFYNEVAQYAIDKGCTMINDVSGGMMDQQMYSTVGKGGAMYGCMHMRGTPQTMTQQKYTTYNNLLEDIQSELQTSIQQAELAGINRWNLMVDPGLGFAKTAEQSLEVAKNLASIRTHSNQHIDTSLSITDPKSPLP